MTAFNFTYYYGNGDSYTGIVYAPSDAYTVGQMIGYFDTEVGSQQGYYTITAFSDDASYGEGYVYVTSYTDGDTGYGSAYSVSGYGDSGLGSESGYAYGSGYSAYDTFSNSNEADFITQYYTFTYTYGNGDSYSGYGYDDLDTYTAGQVLSGYDNETGNDGYYTIGSVNNGSTGYNHLVYVTSYTDGDTGYGSANSVSSNTFSALQYFGDSGLGSESGNAYGSGYSAYDTFSNSNEADLITQYYTFTYNYGNGDSYSGYGYADPGTYVAGQVLSGYGNETGNEGSYTIDSVSDGSIGYNHFVYVTSYTDGDTGYGTTDYASGYGYSGLGSESGYAYGSGYFAYDTFSKSNEADLITQYYTFTYTYGNGDSYSGYGYADLGTYTAGQVLSGYGNDTGNEGFYTIDSVEDYVAGRNNDVYVTSYTDGDTGYGSANSVSGSGSFGLGSESGYAYNSGEYGYGFSNSDEADLYWQKYNFTYHYGNGDSYSGYGYAALGTYTAGQTIDYGYNETGNDGYYIINSVEDYVAGRNNDVYVTSYTDGDTGFSTTTNLYTFGGYSGLGSENGYAFNAIPWTGDTYFTPYYEADLPSVLQVRLNLLADNDGTPGEVLANDQVGLNRSFFVQIQVGDLRGNAAGVVGLNLDFAWDGLILESINFDPTLAINPNFALLQDGTLAYDGLIDNLSGGSLPEFELGQAIGVNQLETFALLHFYAENPSNGTAYFTTTVNEASFADDYAFNAASLDVEQQPIQVLSPYSQYNFTYYYGNGDSYTGYVYAAEGTYAAGQVLEGYSNETGNEGYYEIGSITATTLDSSYNGLVYLTSYTDADTGFGETTNLYNYGNPATYYGLGNEWGYAYDVNGNSSDAYFDRYYEADILGNQLYNFTYYYGNGDSYSGYGYAAVGTYTEGQTLEGYSNETGFSGYYVIDSVALGNTSTSYNGYVYVTSYTDGDTGFGTTTNLAYLGSPVTSSGLGYEYGYAYDANGNSSDAYFDRYYEADILNQYYTFTYTYGNGDSYSGYGYALAGTYTAGQVLSGYGNETGFSGSYTINSVEAGTTNSSQNNLVYVSSYYDGDTGYGPTANIGEADYPWWDGIHGSSGLGSEQGYAYDTNGNSSDAYFNNYYEADILGNQLYNFTYYYGNGDSYSGYGYAGVGTYTAGQTLTGYSNETGFSGYYIIDSVDLGNTSTSYNGYVYLTSYTDADTGYGPTTNIGDANYSWDGIHGYSGLGSEYGYAYDANGYSSDAFFGAGNYEADIQNQYYTFTYTYGNGDSYSGYGYALAGTYAAGQVLSGYGNETGFSGQYTINSVSAGTTDSGYNNRVYVSSYYDGDTGFGLTTNVGEGYYVGYYGLTSEYGYAYDANGNSSDAYFSNYYEADILGNQLYNFTYYYGNGDSYSGYGYAAVGTYTAGQVIGYYPNETVEYPSGTGSVETNTLGYGFGGDSVYHLTYTFTNLSDLLTLNFKGSNLEGVDNESWGLDNVRVTAGGFTYSNDFETDALEGWSSSIRSTTPVGSRNFLGEFANDTVSLSLNNADLANNPITLEFDLFILKTWDGNHQSYRDFFTVQTAEGQTLLNSTFSNPFHLEPQTYPDNLPGYYVIDSVVLGNTNTGYNGQVYVTSYTDADTGFGTTTNLYNYGNPATYSGLGYEASYAYDSNGNSSDPYFSSYYEADILNQYYEFTYTYGNGDSYSGYGYALAGTYAAGQVLSGYSNETGFSGQYTINSVSAGTTDSGYNNRVYVSSYYDGDTGFGLTTNVGEGYYVGYYGLTSEYGYAYDANGNSSDAYFSNYYEADILGNQLYNFTYYYGNGDSYSGYGYAAVGTYTAGQTFTVYGNETGNSGYYVIDSVDLGNVSTWYNGYVYVTSYTDDDTGFGTTTNLAYLGSPVTSSGLGSEYGYAYDANGYSSDAFFTNYYEADIQNQYYTFTYTYGNGDSYSGYGYALAGTYAAGQTIDYGYNETGSYGFYTINSVSAGTTDSGYNNRVYVSSYTDADTGYGTTTNLYSYGGGSGLGSEYGYAYDSNWSSSDSYFDRYSEADILGNQLYNFTYYYGNGDSYSGYGYAAVGTYTEGQTLEGYSNETGFSGYYVIDSVALGNTNTGYNGYVYLTSYFDSDTGFGTTTNLYNYGNPATYYGLGNEASYAYDSNGYSSDAYFNTYYEADILNQKYTFTYTYGNGDSYSGYGYALFGTYTAGQTLDGYNNETGNAGYYTINSVSAGTTDSYYNNRVYVSSYYDGDTGYGLTTNVGEGYYVGTSGLGSEYGYAYDTNGNSSDPYFSNSAEADILGNQLYNFTYYYGNGDSYSGYGYAAVGTYTAGQTFTGYGNETGNSGYYVIDSVDLGNVSTWYNGYVYVTSYTDDDTGFGTTTNLAYLGSPVTSSGLGNEWGYAYDANGYSSDAYFSSYYEADILNQYYTFTYTYGNGDSYSGYGYALAGTYAAGQTLEGYNNETGNAGYYTINSVSAGTTDSYYNNRVYVSSYYDGDTGYGLTTNVGEGYYVGTSGLGSEYGYAYDTNGNSSDPYFSNSAEADILGNQLYNFTYYYGNGDSYSGYGYAAVGTYTAGQTLTGDSNETGNSGYYVIDSVALGNTNTGYNGYVYLTSYTDADTGFGTTTNLYNNGNPATYSGLGNEASYAYDSNGYSSDAYFNTYYEADILNQKYTFTYTYGNGDSYSGYGYALFGTYTAGQTLDGYNNETGNAGYYTINAVEAGTTDSSQNNRVYITSYYDGDTFYGETTNLYSYGGGSGLGSEYGYAYNSNWSSSDAYFDRYYEADLVTAGFSITDNSGNANDASIKFTTQLSSYRSNYSETDWVRPNFADTTKYFDIINNGSGVLQVSDIVSNVAGVTTNFVDDLLINPGASQRISLTYDPSAARENFFVSEGLVLFTNDPNYSQYAIALQGKSTFNSDINYDGKVGVGDLGPLNNARRNFNNGTYDPTADIDGNGLIDSADVTIFNSERGLALV